MVSWHGRPVQEVVLLTRGTRLHLDTVERGTFVSWATSDCDSPVSNRVSTLVLVGVIHSPFGGWRGGVFIVVTLWGVVAMGKIFTVAAYLLGRKACTWVIGLTWVIKCMYQHTFYDLCLSDHLPSPPSKVLLRFPVPMSCNRQRHYTSTNNNNSKLR